MLLHVNELTICLSGKPIIRDLGFQLNEGELMVVLGPNGAGKSTLLKSLASEHKAESGSVRFAGQPLQGWPVRQLARQRAVMPQRVEVNFPLTAEEVVRLGRPPEPKAKGAPIVDELMTLLDITHLRYRLASRLSGGEQQRVQLARVLAQVWDTRQPVLLLLDECTSALDPAHQQLVFSLLRQLSRQRGFAVLAVAHDLNLAARFADRLMLLDQGECYRAGTPDEVLTAPVLANVYGLTARVLQLDEGYPVVIPIDEVVADGYAQPSKPSCRQAS
jgi:iron complex transport system ATP-binding protein